MNLDSKLSCKKKVIILIIGFLISMIMAWLIQSHHEYSGAGYSSPFLDYIKKLSVGKVIDVIIILIPAITMFVFALKSIRKE